MNAAVLPEIPSLEPASETESDADYVGGMEPDVRALVQAATGCEIVLPNDWVPFPFAARRLFKLLAERREAFIRDGVVLELKGGRLEPMTAGSLRSRLDGYGRRVVAVKTLHHGGFALLPKRCSRDNAEALLLTLEASKFLPPIAMVSKTPVLVERNGALVTLGAGYHPDGGGILVQGDAQPPIVEIDEATRELLALLDDFKFATPSDKSRAMAALIGPAIRSGGLLPGHALMTCVEADSSQAGKGYFLRVQQAIYAEAPIPLGRRNGGVGSLDEDLGAQLLRAALFVTFDNVRGRIDSQHLEAILTADDQVSVRVPYQPSVLVSIRRTVFSITSNGIEATLDLANRLMIFRLLKHRPAAGFKKFPEGGLLEHVRAKQPNYLGCVHAVIREWHEAGAPRLETDHTFREWVGALDWIVRAIFDLPPLLDGHQEAVERAGSPALGWLRAVALAVVKTHRLGELLSASAIAELCAEEPIELPGCRSDLTDEERRQYVGKLLGKCYADAYDNEILIDTVHVTRHEHPDPLRTGRVIRRYQFWVGDTRPAAPGWEEDANE